MYLVLEGGCSLYATVMWSRQMIGSLSQIDKWNALPVTALPDCTARKQCFATISIISLSMPYTSLMDYGILSSGHVEAMWKTLMLLNDKK